MRIAAKIEGFEVVEWINPVRLSAQADQARLHPTWTEQTPPDTLLGTFKAWCVLRVAHSSFTNTKTGLSSSRTTVFVAYIGCIDSITERHIKTDSC